MTDFNIFVEPASFCCGSRTFNLKALPVVPDDVRMLYYSHTIRLLATEVKNDMSQEI